MSAPMRSTLSALRTQGRLAHKLFGRCQANSHATTNGSSFIVGVRGFTNQNVFTWSKTKTFKLACGGSFAAAAGMLAYTVAGNSSPIYAASKGKPDPRVSRSIRIPTDSSGLKLTLYQFQTCPFCCKVRAMLDYYGISYDVVEVNSVFKTELKWSEYKKVPVLVCDGGSDESGYMQMVESSVITSILYSHLLDKSVSVEKLITYYPGFKEKNEQGKETWDFPNKYFIMFGDAISDGRPEKSRSDEDKLTYDREERKWRRWTDDVLVHMLSPNVYRTSSEALQAFNYFSEVGEWEKHFSTLNRLCVIYVGATAMYLIGKWLKRKYKLKDDVRESLYDACNEWTKAVGRNRQYMGGDKASLADISVYGVLSSIEGCTAFQDALENTKIGPWFYRMKKDMQTHAGAGMFVK